MPSQNEYVGSFIKIGQWEGDKKRDEIVGGRGECNFEKIWKFQKYHPKMNLCRKFHPCRTMGKC